MKIHTVENTAVVNAAVVAKAIKKPAKIAKPVAKKAAVVKKPLAAKIAKPATEKKPVAAKPLSARAQVALDASLGKMPAPLSWTSPSDKRYVPKIDALNAAAAKRDVKALNAVEIVPYSSYPRRMIKWRELCIIAIRASAKGKAK